ncbi:hypothetical protein EJD97_008332 [Solanum chilense]|uniref:Uncharacterized protein n=1 Tax=Solanum chilense TaxID=4083 RepID=A0A6N2BJU4_SOLCI|nr:hypothetical protein EJD97_008332 [Solanum chilense]
MNIRSMATSRLEEEKINAEMSNIDIREAFIAIARPVTMHVNLNMMPRFMESTMTSRMIDFVRMNPPIFLISKEERASYQLRDVTKIWYTQRKDNQPEGSGPIELEEFKEAILGMFKVEKGGGSKDGKPTCANCGKRHYGESLLGTGIHFGCSKDGHKVRYFPMICSRCREVKQIAPSVPKDDALTKRRFYALRSRVDKPDEKESDDYVGKFSFFCKI